MPFTAHPPVDLESIYEQAPVGLACVDRSLRYVRINARLAAIHNVPVEQHLGRTIREVLGEAVGDAIEPLYRRVIETRTPIMHREVRGRALRAPHDERVWLENYYPLVVGDQVVGVNAVVQDVTELKRGEERQQLLMRELGHRVANSFQIMSTFLAMQRRMIGDRDPGEVLDSALDRLEAAALVHRRLYTKPRSEGREALGQFLRELTGELATALLSGPDCAARLTCVAEADPIVSTDTAVTVGLIVAELVTNACKHAFPDGSEGEIVVRLQTGVGCVIAVEDNGVGLRASGGDAGDPAGLGLTIVRAFAKQVGDGLEVERLAPGARFSTVLQSKLLA